MKSAPPTNQTLVSVIAPLFNEEQNVEPLHAALRAALADSDFDYEVILVDDGSTDRTAAIAAGLARDDHRLTLIKLRRNYGQTPAMSAGIDLAAGQILVTIDGDLQNDPRDIPRLVEHIHEGADLVVGWREERKDHTLSRVLPSRIANWLIARVTGIPIRDNGCSLKAYRSTIIKRIPLYSEMHRFIPAMMSIAGARVEQISVRHHARRFGQSKYGIGRTWRVLFDLLSIKTIVTFSSRPMLWFSSLALLPAILSAVIGAGALVSIVSSEGPAATLVPFAIALQLLALAVFLVACGIIGELVFRSGDTREHRFAALSANLVRTTTKGQDGHRVIPGDTRPGSG